MPSKENLYESPTDILPTPSNDGLFGVSLEGLDFLNFSNIIYTLALFALVFSIFHFCTNFYQFKYFTLSKRAKEYNNEWRGLQHSVSCYRILWTLLVLQFPLIFFYLGLTASDGLSQGFFGVFYIIFFILKIFLDSTHINKLGDFAKAYKYLSFYEQTKVFFVTLSAILLPKPKPPEKPAVKKLAK